MPLTITLHRTDDNRAEVYVAGEHIASFDPAALRLDHPFVRPHQQASDPVAYGQRLLAALGGDNLKRMLTELPSAPQLESMIALHTTDAELAAIPWEFLHNGNEFLITRYLLVREVEVPNALLPAPPLSDQPWRLVVVASNLLLKEVYDEQGRQCDWQLMAPLPVEHELDLLRDDFQKQRLHLRWQQIAPTRSALIDELATIEPLLLHFAGHGAVVNGTPVLYFDDGAGKLDPQTASDLANHLRGMVMLAFLNACRTADSIEPGANLALTLVQHGIPVVLGNQYLVFDEAAAPVARTFYRFLATGLHPAQALYRARLQLQSHRRNEPLAWAVPVLYLARGYQWPKPPVGNQHQPPPPIEPPRPAISALNAPDYATGAFVGRQQELYELARLFVHDQKRIVTIRGTGGIGKTALAAALAHRLRFFFDDGIVALSLVLPGEHATLAAATVRRQLAMALGIDVKDEKSWSADEQEQEDLLITTIRSRRRMLVIWDNYETVLWRLGLETVTDDVAPFAPEQRDEAVAIQRLVRKLADSGAWMLFTTRQSPVGLPGEVCFPPIEAGQQLAGLNPEASVELMRRWISKRTPSETFLRQLADALDHHPLAMVLTIRRWDRGQDAENAFLEQLDQALAEARDPAAPVYQQTSVEISVRLSLAALPPKLQEALRCLTIIANPKITPLHAAVVWEMTEGSQWLVEPAHRQLETLQQTSLLLGHGYDQEHNRALTYAIQPVIATVLRRDAQAHDLSAARIRYGRWAAALVDQAYDSQHGINASAELAQQMQSLLPDIAEALAALPIAERGWALWRATWVLNRLGDPATAWRLIEQANQFAQEHNDEALLSRVYHQQADLLVTRGDLDGALALYQQSLAITERLGDVQGKSATLHAMAHVLVTRGDLDGALALYQQSLAIKERLGDVQGKSATLHAMAHVLVTRGDLDGALALYQQSLAITERLGDVQGKSATLHAMAHVLVTRGDLDGALALYQQSLAIKERLGDVQGKSATLHQMANVLVTRGDLDGALALYQQSLALDESLGDVQGKSATLHQMANVLVTRGDLDGALALYQQSFALWESLGDVKGKSATLHQMAHVLVTRGDLDGALALYQQSLAIKERLGDVKGKSATLHAMAHVLVTRGDLDGALALYQQSLAIKERLGDVQGKSATLHEMAGVLVTRGDLDGALALYQQSLAITERLGDVQGKSATLHVMAHVLVTRGDLDGALALYQQSLAIKERLGDVQGKSATLHAMAHVLVTRGDLDGALALYQQSLAITERLGDVQGKSATLHAMANVLVTRGDLDGALALYQQSLALWESLGDVQGKSATLHQMANVLVTRGDLDGALALYQQSLAIKERLGDVKGKSTTLVMMAQVQFMRGEHDQALCNARESLRLLQAMGAQPDAAKVAEIIQRMEAMRRQAAAPTQGVEGSAQIEEATTALAALLEQLPPTQRAEAQVLLQVAPLLIGAAALLGRADADAERKALAVVLEQAADLAAAGEAAGSPWLAAAATLRTLAGWLAGAPVDLDALAEPYRGLMRQVME